MIAATAVAAAVAPGAAVASAEAEPAICASTTLHDYLTPLKRMPKLRELTFRARGGGRFRGVEISAAGPPLAVNGGRGGYQITWEGNPEWDLTLTLVQVDGKGKPVLWMGRRDINLGKLSPVITTEPFFAIPARPGFYRTTLAIRSRSGRKLARFGNYYRVVKPTVHAELVTNTISYHPGATLFGRVENFGAAFVLFGEGLSVEQLQAGNWAPAPSTPEPVYDGLQFVGPGVTSHRCLSFRIPTSMPPGRYRLSQETVITWPAQDRELRPFLHAGFEVAGVL